MNKKGFTLVELLGVIVILGIIALISIPPILNQMASSEQSIDEATLRVVYSAGSLYLDERQNNFVRNPGNVFCVQIEDLVADGKLDPALSDSVEMRSMQVNTSNIQWQTVALWLMN